MVRYGRVSCGAVRCGTVGSMVRQGKVGLGTARCGKVGLGGD